MIEQHSDTLQTAVGKVEFGLLVQPTNVDVEDGDEHDQGGDGRDPYGEAEGAQQGQVFGDGQGFVAEDAESGLPQSQGVVRHRFTLGTDRNAAHGKIGLLQLMGP